MTFQNQTDPYQNQVLHCLVSKPLEIRWLYAHLITNRQTISYASLVVLFSYQTFYWVDNTGHHQYLNYFGQPEACLLRNHSRGPVTRTQGPFPSILAVAIFCLLVLVRECLKQIHIDGLVNYLDLKTFIDEFNSQNNAQIALVSEFQSPVWEFHVT
jgi:hypothetical protein